MKLPIKPTIALAILVVLGIAYAQTTKPAAAQVSTGAPGRYQIVMNPSTGKSTFLLDSATGKVWQWVTVSDVVGEPEIWDFKTRIDNDADFSKWLMTHKFKP